MSTGTTCATTTTTISTVLKKEKSKNDGKTMHRFYVEVWFCLCVLCTFFRCADIKSFINAQHNPKLMTPGGDTWVTTTIATTCSSTAMESKQLNWVPNTAVDPLRKKRKRRKRDLNWSKEKQKLFLCAALWKIKNPLPRYPISDQSYRQLREQLTHSELRGRRRALRAARWLLITWLHQKSY